MKKTVFVIFSVLHVYLLGLGKFLRVIHILCKILICNVLKNGVKNI